MDPSLSQERIERLQERFNKITDKIAENLDVANDISVKGQDIVEYLENDGPTMPDGTSDNYLEAFNVGALLQDFAFIRETLRTNANSGKELLGSLTADIEAIEPQDLAELVNSFAELNRSITDNLNMYIRAYKELSNIVINLQKAKNVTGQKTSTSQQVNNTAIVLSSGDIFKRIAESVNHDQT